MLFLLYLLRTGVLLMGTEELYSDRAGKFLINGKVLALTKHFEGFEPIARDDGYGTPTIGYGRITWPDGRKVRNGEKITEQEASVALLHDLETEGSKYVRAFLRDDVENALSGDEFSVLVDLCFNRGCGRLREFIVPLLNAGASKDRIAAAISDTKQLHYAAGRYSLGLHRRRWAERRVWEGKDWHEFDTVAKFKAFVARGFK